jgi:arsenical pump membrane protein
VTAAADQLELLAPALAFLLAAVPLAHLLGELGFFHAVARRVSHRVDGVWPWWLLAAGTTAVLNLDTTVVLLTPLYLQVARRRGENPLVLAVIPFLLANLASSVLPVSNLTTLIATERFDIGTADLLHELGPATAAMLIVGFLAHRRWAARVDRGASDLVAVGAVGAVGADDGVTMASSDPVSFPDHEPDLPDQGGEAEGDRRALVLGGAVVAGLLVAFVLGPAVGISAWQAALVADVVLVLALRSIPWRTVPLGTAVAVAVLGVAVALAVPGDRLGALVDHPGAGGAILGSLTAAGLAATVDNLPALLALLQGVDRGALMPVLLGVNAGAVLTPIGSLANLLWLRTMRARGVVVAWSDALAIGLRVGGPAFLAGVVVLAVQRGLGA